MLLLLEVGTLVGGKITTDQFLLSLITASSLLQVSGCWCGPGGVVVVVVVVLMVLLLDVGALVGGTISADYVPLSLIMAPSLLQISTGCWCGCGDVIVIVVVVWMALSLDVGALVGGTISADHVPA